VGFGVVPDSEAAPCCAANIPAKNPVSPSGLCPRAGGGERSRASARLVSPPPDWPVWAPHPSFHTAHGAITFARGSRYGAPGSRPLRGGSWLARTRTCPRGPLRPSYVLVRPQSGAFLRPIRVDARAFSARGRDAV